MNEHEASVYYTTEVKKLQFLKVGSFFRESLQAEVDDYVGLEYNERAHRLEALVLQEHLADDYYETAVRCMWPGTAWQMFKQTHESSWWLRWFVGRYPVQKVSVDHDVRVKVERYVNYPEANIAIPKLGRPVPYEALKDMRYR